MNRRSIIVLLLINFAFALEDNNSTSPVWSDPDSPLKSQKCTALYEIPKENQCSFIRNECKDYKLGYANYLELYYCTFSFLHSFAFLPLVCNLAILFVSLGLTASEYLCPNLHSISKVLQLSDNLAGLTLLALGNGAPDILSTFQGMSLDSSDLAISELTGAAFFITTVVIGTMGIVHPFKVPKVAFLRDLGFFICFLAVVLTAILKGVLTFFHCIILVAMYVVYVVVVVCSHSITKMKTRQRLREERSRGNFVELGGRNVDNEIGDEEEDIFLDDINQLPSIEALHMSSIPIDQVSRIDSALSLPGSFGLNTLLKNLQKHSNHRIQLPGDDHIRSVSAPAAVESTPPLEDDIHDIEELDETSIPRYNNTFPVSSDYQASFFLKLLFPSFLEFKELDMQSKIRTVIMSPVLFLLRVSIPVRDQACIDAITENERKNLDIQLGIGNIEENDASQFDVDGSSFEIDKVLLQVQNFLSNIFITYVWCNGDPYYWTTILPMSIFVSCIISYATYMMYNQNPSRRRIIFHISSFFGFVSALSWISIFATEVIGILKMISLVYDVSDEILGMTVFALGNSIGDFISNFTIAKMGMPLMAFGACFGGPVLTFSSMGFSGALLSTNISSQAKNSFASGFNLGNSSTLLTIFVGLLLNSIFLLVMVPRNNWLVDRDIGRCTIFIWAVVTSLCIFIEFK
ncbi:hypothetical protein CLIB1423_28S00540 [[Candida] railenensis]|uniref:Sodium/calcium exchanger membrane region domain-containing protein n=1 Tax=[Candida] railenensis TaxID=45579 RepID=A0A9P0W1D7_9ASCO|nr:hypothetical protein CLIB1423_28S00540 [[Candida] railenensis]